jgi:hypothetical protein
MDLHGHEGYRWNPRGTGMSHRLFPYAIIQLSHSETQLIVKRAKENEANLIASRFGDHYVQFKYKVLITLITLFT